MRKLLVMVLCMAVALVFGLTACGNGTSDGSAAGGSASAVNTADADSTEEVELKVGMLGKDIKACCVIIADAEGFFKDEHLNVKLQNVDSLPDGLTAVSTGKLDVLPFGVIPSCSYISQGTDVTIFGGTISEGSEGLTKGDETYTDLSQFKGKTIACFRMETGHMVLKGLLREEGLEIGKDVKFVYMDSQQSIVEAVKKGETDIGMVNSGFGYVAKQSGLNVAFQVGDFEKDFPCCRQTTSKANVEDPAKRSGLVRFEKAMLKAYAVYQNDHDKTIEILKKYSGQDDAYVESVIYGTDDYDNAMIISLDPNKNKVSDFYDVMKANGDIDKDTEYDVNDYIDTSIYQEALQSLIDEGQDKELYEGLMEDFHKNND